MRQWRSILAGSLLASSLLQASLTVDDNKYITAYNKEISTLNQNFGALRTFDDYKDPKKRAKVEESFRRVKEVIKSFSDQKDRQVVSMQSSYKNMVRTYNSNLKSAGVSSTPKSSAKSVPQKSSSEKSLSELISDYNRIYNRSFKDYNAMRTDADIKDPKQQAQLNKDYKELTATLEAIKPLDPRTYQAAKRGYDDWVDAYKSKAKHFSGTNAVATASTSSNTEMTSEDRNNLKKFRSLYIENDYYFRNVDTVRLQDPTYRRPLESKLHQLQALLNPMRHKTFDRGVKRADSDLKKIEDIFASASTTSKKMAASVGNIEEEFKTIQSVFNKEQFDPRLQRDYISGDARNPQEVKEWAEMLKEYKELIPDMTKFLDKVRNNTVEGRKPAFAGYRHWFVNNVEDDIDDAINDSTRRWKTEMFNGITKYRNYKPAQLDRTMNSQSEVKELMEEYTIGMKALENQKVFDKVMLGTYAPATKKYIKDYAAYDKKLIKAKQMTLKNQRVPQAVENNPKLLALAKSLVQGNNSNISHMRITRKFMHNKVLKYSDGWYLLKWDSFIVSYVEKRGNRYFVKTAIISKNIAARYGVSNADWYARGTNLEGDEILKENIS